MYLENLLFHKYLLTISFSKKICMKKTLEKLFWLHFLGVHTVQTITIVKTLTIIQSL